MRVYKGFRDMSLGGVRGGHVWSVGSGMVCPPERGGQVADRVEVWLGYREDVLVCDVGTDWRILGLYTRSALPFALG